MAITKLLRSKNWEVTCTFLEQIRSIVEDAGLPFVDLSRKFLELLESEEGIMFMGGKVSILKKMKALLWMIKASKVVQKEAAAQRHDLIESEDLDLVKAL